VEPGYFRTSLIAAHLQLPKPVIESSAKIAAYDTLRTALDEGLELYDGSQQGDPEKAVARILDFVESPEKLGTKAPIVRVCLGTDAIKHISDMCKSTLKDLDETNLISSSTDL
jgi:hypothetical protein